MLADLRYALRALRRHPAFAAAVAGILALGIGANTAIFSVVNAVLLRGLPYPAPERLVMAFTTYPDFGHSGTSQPDFLDWRDGFRGAGELAAFGTASYNLTGDGAPERADGAAVTANYFRVLGASPALGRAFLADEERAAVPTVVMLGHDYWRRRFGADRGVVGRTITLNGVPRTVVGVAPAGLVLPRAADVLVPLRVDTALGRRSEFLTVVGRLAPGVTVERARGVMATVAARLSAQYPATNPPRLSVDVTSMQAEVVGAARPALLVLAGAVGLVLLVACANVANLLLVRTERRRREIATRAAVGAGRGRLARQLFAEGVVLAALGGAAGLALAAFGARLFRLVPGMPAVEGLVAGRAALFAVTLAAATTVLFALAPALTAARAGDGAELLRAGARQVARRAPLRTALMAVQFAASLALLGAGGLFVRSLRNVRAVDVGFDAERTLVAAVDWKAFGLDDAAIDRAQRAAAARLRATPGVAGATRATFAPFRGVAMKTLRVPGRGDLGAISGVPGGMFFTNVVDSAYATTLGIPVVRGRWFALVLQSEILL